METARKKYQPIIILIAVLLAFVAVLFLIWRWYALKNAALENLGSPG